MYVDIESNRIFFRKQHLLIVVYVVKHVKKQFGLNHIEQVFVDQKPSLTGRPGAKNL